MDEMIALDESELATVSGAKMSFPSFQGKLTAVLNSPISVTGVNIAEIAQSVTGHGDATVELEQGNASNISIG